MTQKITVSLIQSEARMALDRAMQSQPSYWLGHAFYWMSFGLGNRRYRICIGSTDGRENLDTIANDVASYFDGTEAKNVRVTFNLD